MAFWHKDKVATTTSGITIRSVREDRPAFKREYSQQLDDGRSIKITMQTRYGRSRSGNGELTQRDGRWVLFDPERVADKIIDPVLVPKIESAIKEIFQLDRNFMSNSPGEFVDEDGTKWCRV